MEEEKKEEQKEEKKTKVKAILKTTLKIILGLIFVALGLGAIFIWRVDVLTVIKGCVGVFVLLAGIICFAIAKE